MATIESNMEGAEISKQVYSDNTWKTIEWQ